MRRGPGSSTGGALALDPERGEARLLAAKLAALADAALAEAAGPWLLQEGDPALALARVARSDSPLAAYLAGRAFASRGAPRHAIPLLARAALSPLPDASFGFEARRLLAQARCAAGEWEQGISGFVALGRDAARAADQARAADGARRCRMERDLFAKPVEAPPDWSPVYGK
jgi:hypothetical protein